MSGLVISTWLWGDKYSLDYVHRLQNGIARHLKQPHRFVLVTDWRGSALANVDGDVVGIERADLPLLRRPGCLARLRMFDPAWQASVGVAPGDRLVCVDLDAIVTGPIDPLFDRLESFVILQGANSRNPCPFNGSLMMLWGGRHAHVWRDFDLERARREVPFYKFLDDQAYLAHALKYCAPGGWQAGSASGVYAFRKPGWPAGSDDLPVGARLVVFPGARDPSQFTRLSWIARHWRVMAMTAYRLIAWEANGAEGARIGERVVAEGVENLTDDEILRRHSVANYAGHTIERVGGSQPKHDG